MKPIQNLTCRHALGLAFLVSLLAGSATATPPVITNISLLPNREIELQLVVTKGQSYIFEVSTNLVNWMEVGGLENAPTNFLTVVDEEPVDGTSARFYRMREGVYQRFDFSLMHFVQAGQFAPGATTPSVTYPVQYWSYSGIFDVEGGAPYPDASQVFFTGPAASGLSATPASNQNSGIDEWGAWYQSPEVLSSAGAPAGTWTVNYKGTNMNFLADLQPLARLVIPVPTVTVANGLLQSVSWVYRDRVTGQALTGPPGYMVNVQLQAEGPGGRIYNSDYEGDPAQTTHTLSSPVTWANVTLLTLAYDDQDENHFVIFFQRSL